MSKIKFDERNYRIHGEENKKVIKNSLEENGAGRSILVDNDGNIIAGNGVFEQWGGGRPVKVIESDGTELIVVKRNDIKPDDPRRMKLAISDNSANDLSEFDFNLMQEDLKLLSFDEIELLGLDAEKFCQEENEQNPQPKLIKKEEIRAFKKTHVLFSFSPEVFLKIQELLQQIKDTEGVEYEQGSN
jgi:hypothetical protein